MNKCRSLFLALSLLSLPLSLCATQKAAPEQKVVTAPVSEPAKQETKVATDPITVTIKQTGTPSLKTFYTVPVEITITNNLDHYVDLGRIYLNNTPIYPTVTGKKVLGVLGFYCVCALALGEVVMKSGSFSAIAIKELANSIRQSYTGNFPCATNCHLDPRQKEFPGKVICDYIPGCSNNPNLTEKITGKMFDISVLFFLGASCLDLATTQHLLKPHKTITINNFLSKADMKKIQEIQATPSTISTIQLRSKLKTAGHAPLNYIVTI